MNNKVIDNIIELFDKGFYGKATLVPGIPADYPAWVYKEKGEYGVIVIAPNDIVFSERFSSVRIWTHFAKFNNRDCNLLALTCSKFERKNEFASICSQFIETGSDGKERRELVENPKSWWNKWKDLLGNKSIDSNACAVIGELAVLEKLYENGKKPRWSGPDAGTQDVEIEKMCFEVKTTQSRHNYEVKINSIFQMKNEGESLDLVFLRYEKSLLGRSINDLVDSLEKLGANTDELESVLQSMGMENGRTVREIKYKLLEAKVYRVDEHFPALTLDSFVGGVMPTRVKRITYTLDLTDVEGRNFDSII